MPEDGLPIGTVGYQVYVGPDGKPWVCRMRLTAVSPKGKSRTWETVDAEPAAVEKRPTYDAPAPSRGGAITRFQLQNLCMPYFADNGPERLRLILEAEKLRVSAAWSYHPATTG